MTSGNLNSHQVYRTFKAKAKDSNELIDYIIQDLPETRFEEALDLYVDCFLPDEAMSISKNISNQPNSTKIFREIWLSFFQQRLAVGCFTGDELVGVNCLILERKNGPKEKTDVRMVMLAV
jgi:hypothetical protein